MSLTATGLHVALVLAARDHVRMCEFMRPPQPTKPTLMRSLAPSTRPVAKVCGAALAAVLADRPAPTAAAPAPTCLMKSRLLED